MNDLRNKFEEFKEKLLEKEEITRKIRNSTWNLGADEIRKEMENLDKFVEDYNKASNNLKKISFKAYCFIISPLLILTILSGEITLNFLVRFFGNIGIYYCILGIITDISKSIKNTKLLYVKSTLENELENRMEFEYQKTKQDYDNKQNIEVYEPIKSLEDSNDKTKTK